MLRIFKWLRDSIRSKSELPLQLSRTTADSPNVRTMPAVYRDPQGIHEPTESVSLAEPANLPIRTIQAPAPQADIILPAFKPSGHPFVVDTSRYAPPPPPAVKPDNGASRPFVVPQPPSNVEHPTAVYFDKNAKLVTVNYRELQDDKRFIEVRRQALMTPDFGFRLAARLGGTTRVRHFYTPSEGRIDRLVIPAKDQSESVQERNDEHDKRVRWLVHDLNKIKPITMFTFEWDSYWATVNRLPKDKRPDVSDVNDVNQFVLASLEGYRWASNRKHFPMADRNVCPDIIGIPHNRPIAKPTPRVFIEVINTHPPSDATWNAYLEHSLREPLIVAFDFTKMPNYWARAYQDNISGAMTGAEPRFRTALFISEGSFYKNTKPQRIGNAEFSADAFEDLMRIELERRPIRPSAVGKRNITDTPEF